MRTIHPIQIASRFDGPRSDWRIQQVGECVALSSVIPWRAFSWNWPPSRTQGHTSFPPFAHQRLIHKDSNNPTFSDEIWTILIICVVMLMKVIWCSRLGSLTSSQTGLINAIYEIQFKLWYDNISLRCTQVLRAFSTNRCIQHSVNCYDKTYVYMLFILDVAPEKISMHSECFFDTLYNIWTNRFTKFGSQDSVPLSETSLLIAVDYCRMSSVNS